MKYVILRDDDANGLTPPSLLEQLYRPFLDQGMPVHLSLIPEVRTDIRVPSGELEGFLLGERAGHPGHVAIEENQPLVEAVKREPLYVALQHGLSHAFIDGRSEFDSDSPEDVAWRLDRGKSLFAKAGLGEPIGFVAPQDRLSRVSLRELQKRFRFVSTQYLNLARVPRHHWPAYLVAKKLLEKRHVRLGKTWLFTHPGCLLAPEAPVGGLLDRLILALRDNDVTVIVSHHWHYFNRDGSTRAPLLRVLHAFAKYLGASPDVRVVRFDEAVSLGDGP